jgi:hypothetical protein
MPIVLVMLVVWKEVGVVWSGLFQAMRPRMYAIVFVQEDGCEIRRACLLVTSSLSRRGRTESDRRLGSLAHNQLFKGENE